MIGSSKILFEYKMCVVWMQLVGVVVTSIAVMECVYRETWCATGSMSAATIATKQLTNAV